MKLEVARIIPRARGLAQPELTLSKGRGRGWSLEHKTKLCSDQFQISTRKQMLTHLPCENNLILILHILQGGPQMYSFGGLGWGGVIAHSA